MADAVVYRWSARSSPCVMQRACAPLGLVCTPIYLSIYRPGGHHQSALVASRASSVKGATARPTRPRHRPCEMTSGTTADATRPVCRVALTPHGRWTASSPPPWRRAATAEMAVLASWARSREAGASARRPASSCVASCSRQARATEQQGTTTRSTRASERDQCARRIVPRPASQRGEGTRGFLAATAQGTRDSPHVVRI